VYHVVGPAAVHVAESVGKGEREVLEIVHTVQFPLLKCSLPRLAKPSSLSSSYFIGSSLVTGPSLSDGAACRDTTPPPGGILKVTGGREITRSGDGAIRMGFQEIVPGKITCCAGCNCPAARGSSLPVTWLLIRGLHMRHGFPGSWFCPGRLGALQLPVRSRC
jgi:hypothetical protein